MLLDSGKTIFSRLPVTEELTSNPGFTSNTLTGTGRNFLTTDFTDYTDFFLLVCEICVICGLFTKESP